MGQAVAFTTTAALPSRAAVLLSEVFSMGSFFSESEELYELIFTSLYFRFTWSMVVFLPAPQQVDVSSQKFLQAQGCLHYFTLPYVLHFEGFTLWFFGFCFSFFAFEDGLELF